MGYLISNNFNSSIHVKRKEKRFHNSDTKRSVTKCLEINECNNLYMFPFTAQVTKVYRKIGC